MSTLNDLTSLLALPNEAYATSEGGTLRIPQTNMWVPKLTVDTMTENTALSLGVKLLIPLSVLCLTSLILLIITLFSPIPFISVKFALFLVLFSGGFIAELLYARKQKKNV